MEIKKAFKVTEVEFEVIDGEQLQSLFDARVKQLSIFDEKYNIKKSKVINENGVEFEYILQSVFGVLKNGYVVTSESEIFYDMDSFLGVYELEAEDEDLNNDTND
jgi:hypothetical protein